MNDVEWMDKWCESQLGAAPVEVLLASDQMSSVTAVRLGDGRTVVVKSRPDESGRAVACVAVQELLAGSGFPCARPLTGVSIIDGLAIHAEEWRPGGDIHRGASPEVAAPSAALLAELMALTVTADVAPPLPNPVWVRWDHDDPGLWPVYEWYADRAAVVAMSVDLDAIFSRVRARLAHADLPRVIGHADWEAQNLRWHESEPFAVHDWDSLAWLPEAVLVGAAAGAFASVEVPTLAPVESSAAFLDSYEVARGRVLTIEEREVAWAASLLPAAHNARGETLYDSERVAATALRDQAEARLALARA